MEEWGSFKPEGNFTVKLDVGGGVKKSAQI